VVLAAGLGEDRSGGGASSRRSRLHVSPLSSSKRRCALPVTTNWTGMAALRRSTAAAAAARSMSGEARVGDSAAARQRVARWIQL
jgi:hypothetical protein